MTETVERLSLAFEEAWERIRKSGQPLHKEDASELIAKHIIELAQRGERDAVRLCHSAIEFMASKYGTQVKRDYRVYVINDTHHVAQPPTIISCKSDQEAIEHANQLLGPGDIEI